MFFGLYSLFDFVDIVKDWCPLRPRFGGVGAVEVNQVVENLGVSHFHTRLCLDKSTDFVNVSINGDGYSFVAFGYFHAITFTTKMQKRTMLRATKTSPHQRSNEGSFGSSTGLS
jgi:hypothetical protein